MNRSSQTARFLFLDFDGVLNRSGEYYGGERISPVLVSRVAALVAAVDAQIVISSDWRHYADLSGLRAYLAPAIDAARIIGTTPKGRGHGFAVRGEEIAAWLVQRGTSARVAVLDDTPVDFIHLGDGRHVDRFDMTAVRPWFVKTNPHLGVTDANIAHCRRLLTSGPVWAPTRTREACFA